MDPSALLANVLEAPEEDAPRLVYADWLLEQGDASERARGEFIQVSCALAKRPDAPAVERAPLVRRAMELLGTHELTWIDALLEPLPRRRVWHAGAVDWRWSRGFVEAYFKHTGVFTFGDELATVQARTPLNDVSVGLWELDQVRAFLALPGIKHLRGLTIDLWPKLGPEALSMLCDTEALASLERLSVRFGGHDELGRLVSVAGAFPRLKELHVEWSEHPEPPTRRDLEALAGSPLARTVQRLSLERAVFGEQLAQLTALPFDLTKLSVRANDAGPLLGLLANSTALPKLRVVEVSMRHGSGAPWSVDGATSLVASRRLEGLRLSGSDHVDLARLFAAQELSGLRSLSLPFNSLDDDALAPLTVATHLDGLRELELNHNQLTNDAAKAIVKAPHLSRLRRLSLRRNVRIGVAAFSNAKGFAELEHLDLRDNSISEKSPAVAKLRQRFGAAAITGFDPELDVSAHFAG